MDTTLLVVTVIFAIGILIVTSVAIARGVFFITDSIREKLKHRSTPNVCCPYCNTELEVPTGSEGRDARCLNCNQKFTITTVAKTNITKTIFYRIFLYLRNTPIVVASIILSIAIIVASILHYNTDRYYFIRGNTGAQAIMIDKNTGKAYFRSGRVVDWTTGEVFDSK